MAEIAAGAFMTVLFEKLASVDLINLALSEGINSQLTKWKKNLTLIQAVLADAAQQQITQKQVGLWVNELQDLAYDIDDVLDDMATEVMQRKLNQESHGSTSNSKVLKIIPACCTNFTPLKMMYGHKMSTKLDEINTKLHELVVKKNSLGLKVIMNVEKANRSSRQEQTSILDDEFSIVGREMDKKKLLKLLAYETSIQNVAVLSIVGLGGVGKTTLAKVLYNDKEVKARFDLMAWVCVYEEFNVFEISKAIFREVNGKYEHFANLNPLHVALKEKLSNKKFLLVLDDVWDEDYKKWEVLRSPLLAGAFGSKIVVTTRNQKVAKMMDSFQIHDLNVLSYEKSLSLLAQSALDVQNFDKHPKLKLHAEGIMKKCGGLPLALKTLGRALRTKTDDDEWEEMLNSEIWDLKDERDIIPAALRLSYYDLPPHLKHLFAYCSLFPKDFMFDKNKLVLRWVAEGFIYQSNSNKSQESLGHQYFEELKSRSFFQSLTSYKPKGIHDTQDIYYANLGSLLQRFLNERPIYIMHDLINDLAKSVAGDFFIRLDDKMDMHDRRETLVNLRHFSFTGSQYGVCRKFMELQRPTCLRTFMTVSIWKKSSEIVLLLPLLRFVRVLKLSNCSLKEVPESIGDLKHLRYLNLSKTAIERLPEQVSNLYNLQSLLVHGCSELSVFPGVL